MKTRLSRAREDFNDLCVVVVLVSLTLIAKLMPVPREAGRHRAPGRATRAGNRALRERVNENHIQQHRFVELRDRVDSDTLGRAWMDSTDEFTIPPLPQRRFRRLNPRALAADMIRLRHRFNVSAAEIELDQDQAALAMDQYQIHRDFERAIDAIKQDSQA